MHLPLRPIFRQSHPEFYQRTHRVRLKIWAQLTKIFSQKSSYKKIPMSTLCPSCPLTFTHWHAYLHPLNLRCIFLPFGRFCTIVTPHYLIIYSFNCCIILQINAIICTLGVFPALVLCGRFSAKSSTKKF